MNHSPSECAAPPAHQEHAVSPADIVLVRNSWCQVEPIRDVAARLFYGRLFELDPSLKPLFRGDLTAQGEKLMDALRLVVASLDRLDELLPTVQRLAQRHVGYGVQPANYDTVGRALLWTLHQGLGVAFTPAVRNAWARAYRVLAEAMQAAAWPQAADLAPQAGVMRRYLFNPA